MHNPYHHNTLNIFVFMFVLMFSTLDLLHSWSDFIVLDLLYRIYSLLLIYSFNEIFKMAAKKSICSKFQMTISHLFLDKLVKHLYQNVFFD